MLEGLYSVNKVNTGAPAYVGKRLSKGVNNTTEQRDDLDLNCLQKCGEWSLIINSKINNKFYTKNSIIGKCNNKENRVSNSNSNGKCKEYVDIFPIDVGTAQQLVLDRSQEKITFNIEYDLKSSEVPQFSNLNKDYSHFNFELFLNCYLHEKQILNKDINFTVKGYDIVKSIHNKIIDLFNQIKTVNLSNNQTNNQNSNSQALTLNPGVIYHASVFSNIQCSIAIDFTVNQLYKVERHLLNYYSISNSEIKIVKLYVEYYLPKVMFNKKTNSTNGKYGGNVRYFQNGYNNNYHRGGPNSNQGGYHYPTPQFYNNMQMINNPGVFNNKNGNFQGFGYYPQQMINNYYPGNNGYKQMGHHRLNSNNTSQNTINTNNSINTNINYNSNKYPPQKNISNYQFYPKNYNNHQYKSYNNFSNSQNKPTIDTDRVNMSNISIISNSSNTSASESDLNSLEFSNLSIFSPQNTITNSTNSLDYFQFNKSYPSCNWHNFMTMTTPLIQQSENTTILSLFKQFEKLSIFGLDCKLKNEENKISNYTYYPSLSSLFLEFNNSNSNNQVVNKSGFSGFSGFNPNDLNSTLDCSFFSHTSHTSTNEDNNYTIKNYINFQEESEVWNRELIYDKVKEIIKSDSDLEDISLNDISSESYFAVLWTEKDCINPYNFASHSAPSFLVFYRFRNGKRLTNSVQFLSVIGFISSFISQETFWFGNVNTHKNRNNSNDLYFLNHNKFYFSSFVTQAHRFVNYNKINDNIDYKLLTKSGIF